MKRPASKVTEAQKTMLIVTMTAIAKPGLPCSLTG
jgi:hypothetical protein